MRATTLRNIRVALLLVAVATVVGGGGLDFQGRAQEGQGTAKRGASVPKAEHTGQAPEPAKDGWSKAVEGLQCRLRADKAVWKAGEVPKFRLDVRNQGKRDLEI